ncbi:F0F1 ATP synthase subunit alpha [Spiribacter onubensis]|uniref:ATP synthase subunit alpha n=1 Tax=Spiribacter onubensis TaxID=3122420 RepID=A0ABV3SAM3_9GAMM
MTSLRRLPSNLQQLVGDALERIEPRPRHEDIGIITAVGNGVARVRGLHRVAAESLVAMPGGILGIALDLDEDELGVILLGDDARLSAGQEVRALGRLVDTPVGEGLLGRVLDASGTARDGQGAITADTRWPVEREAPPIMARAPVETPLQTGLKAVDALVPIGRGQRELIVGDRQTGKTAIAIASLVNQADTDVINVYCAVGQRGTAVARVIDDLRDAGVMDRTVVMVAAGEDPPGLQYITPYAAMTVAEYFRDKGRDVLLVLDDLTRHARAYRELSLLLRRPPGREAYPGDIFYVHSRLLERATHLRDSHGGGSVTALPIVETQAEDISAYIPTNLISITDGQIYLSPRLFRKGLMPAVDVGRSVSRVGGKTQLPAYRVVAGDLRLAYSQFEELETFSRFATRLDEETRQQIIRGRRVREILKQGRLRTLSVPEQIITLQAANLGLFDTVDVDAVQDLADYLRQHAPPQLNDLPERMAAGKKLEAEDWDQLESVLREQADQWRSTGEAD